MPSEDALPINESCTRFRLIDPILVDVLGWPRACVDPELPGGQGERGGRARLDYLLRDEDGAWFVVEAKKRTPPLVLPDGHSGKFKLDGPVLRNEVMPIVEHQMAPYIGLHLPAFGIVTNGDQWIAFLAATRSSTTQLADSRALVFRSLDDILKDKFELFYRCFAASEVRRRVLESELRATRGAVTCTAPSRGVALDQDRPLSYQQDEEFYRELKRAMTVAFTNVANDPAALEACFVQSRQSRDADTRLQQIENELSETLADAAKYPPFAEQQIKDHPGAAGHAVEPAEMLHGKGCLARILGERSAGKSWFLRRFYETQLPAERRKQAAVVWIDAEEFEPFDARRVSLSALNRLRDHLFGGAPDWDQLVNVYAKEWRAWLRPQGVGPADAAIDLRREFARATDAQEKADPSAALFKYAEFAVRNRQRLPCFVIDNADGPDRSKLAADWAIAVHKSTFALTTLAVDDVTLWRLRSEGDEDYVARHDPEQFWLPRPKVKEVIENRCQYLSTVLRQSSSEGSTFRTAVGYKKQYRWTVDVDKLAGVVSAVLLEDQKISSWIGEICNFDIRNVLDLCKEVVLSPRVHATELLKSQATGKIDRRRIMRAIISPKNEQYQNRADDRVMNVFGHWVGDEWVPLLPFRVLAYLAHREDAERNRGDPFPGFVLVSKIEALFATDLGTPLKLVVDALERLRSQFLIEPDDPSGPISGQHTRVHVTPRGRLHLEWVFEPTYVRMMAEVDPICELGVARDLKVQWEAFLEASRSGESMRAGRMQNAETQMIRCYLDYVVQAAERVAPLRGELEAVRDRQDLLFQHWLQR